MQTTTENKIIGTTIGLIAGTILLGMVGSIIMPKYSGYFALVGLGLGAYIGYDKGSKSGSK